MRFELLVEGLYEDDVRSTGTSSNGRRLLDHFTNLKNSLESVVEGLHVHNRENILSEEEQEKFLEEYKRAKSNFEAFVIRYKKFNDGSY